MNSELSAESSLHLTFLIFYSTIPVVLWVYILIMKFMPRHDLHIVIYTVLHR